VLLRAAVVAGLAVSGLAAVAQTPSPESTLVAAAADALGGRDRLLALRSLRIEGSGQLASQMGGGNITGSPDAPQKWINIVDHERTIDLATERSRVRQRNVTGFVFARLASYGRTRQNQVVDGAIAYNVGADGVAVRAADAVARTRRMEMRANPVVIVRAALASGTRLSNLQTKGNVQTVDITTGDGDRLTLAVDPTTRLPEWVSWVGRDENLGDVTYRTHFLGYDAVNGIQLPMAYTTKIDWRDTTLQTLMVDRNSVDVPVDDMAAPAQVRAAAPPRVVPEPRAGQVGEGVRLINRG
jgi:hypothetical protein